MGFRAAPGPALCVFCNAQSVVTLAVGVAGLWHSEFSLRRFRTDYPVVGLGVSLVGRGGRGVCHKDIAIQKYKVDNVKATAFAHRLQWLASRSAWCSSHAFFLISSEARGVLGR